MEERIAMLERVVRNQADDIVRLNKIANGGRIGKEMTQIEMANRIRDLEKAVRKLISAAKQTTNSALFTRIKQLEGTAKDGGRSIGYMMAQRIERMEKILAGTKIPVSGSTVDGMHRKINEVEAIARKSLRKANKSPGAMELMMMANASPPNAEKDTGGSMLGRVRGIEAALRNLDELIGSSSMLTEGRLGKSQQHTLPTEVRNVLEEREIVNELHDTGELV